MEISVSFTDGTGTPESSGPADDSEAPGGWIAEDSEAAGGWTVEETVLGSAYIPREGVIINGPVAVRYEKYPWIEKFELDGIRPAPAKRTGIGTKDAKGFVKSLSSIWSGAYDHYYEYGGDEAFDPAGYFAHATDHFTALAGDERTERLFRKFAGFAENMWREGDREMLDTVTETVIPRIMKDDNAGALFMDSITDEFRRYLAENRKKEFV